MASATTSPGHQSAGTRMPTVASAASSAVTTTIAVSALPAARTMTASRPALPTSHESAEIERPRHAGARRPGRLRGRDDEREVRQAVAEDQRCEQPRSKDDVAVKQDPCQAGDQRSADREWEELGDRSSSSEVSARPVGAGRAETSVPTS